MRHKSTPLFALAAVVLFSLSPLAADPVIHRGVDTFTTVADGNTFYDFAQQPIPAGFFCAKSAPFAGRVAFRGLPLASGVRGGLNGADTIIERLDDAAFDDAGSAVTRIRFKALSLVSISPIATRCGNFHLYVSLAGEQRETEMRISRTHEKGGTFSAPLAVDARLTFVPVRQRPGTKARQLEMAGSFTFPAAPIPWTFDNQAQVKRLTSITIDTNGDQKPDSRIFNTSNFTPAGSTPAFQLKLPAGCVSCPGHITCHTDPSTGKQHCTTLVVCAPQRCPDEEL